MSINITLHGTDSGVCSLSGKEADGFLVEFKDEGEGQVFLSQKSFLALAKMKLAKGKNGKPNGATIEGKGPPSNVGIGPPSNGSKPPVATVTK